MSLMSSSLVLCHCLSFTSQHSVLASSPTSLGYNRFQSISLRGERRKKLWRFVPSAEKEDSHTGNSKRRRSWWQRFFFDDDGNWLGLRDDDIVDETAELEKDDEMSDEEKFETWKRRAEAIVELREGQEEIGDNNVGDVSKKWEDWIVDSDDSLVESWSRGDEGSEDRSELDELTVPERGLVKMVRDMVLGVEEEDILYEDRVFRYASSKSVSYVLTPCNFNICFLLHVLSMLIVTLCRQSFWRC